MSAMAPNVFADFTIEAGETYVLTAGETFTVDGNLAIEATGTLDASATGVNISLNGNWDNQGGTFTPGDSTVTFTNTPTVLTSTITGATTFNNLTCVTPSKQLTFAANSIQTISNTLTLNGQASGTEIQLRSSSAGTRWTFDVTGAAQTVEYVDVQDSDASSNDITADNSINSGNNDDIEASPHWIFGNSIYITSPQGGYTVGQEPTMLGYTTNPSTAFTIQGTSGGGTVVVASGTSDSNGNFRVVVDSGTPLDVLDENTLRPYVGTNAGPAVNIIVDASPAPSQVPTVDSPSEGDTITTNPFTVSGFAAPNTEVRIQALDTNSDLVLNCGSTTSDEVTGAYSLSCDAVANALAAGANALTVTTYDGSGDPMTTSDIVNVIFTNPFGVVFDSVSDNLIENSTVTIYYDNDRGAGRTWIQAVPDVHIDAGDANPQTTAADGFYSYSCINGDFYINITAAGYDYPTTKADAELPAGRTIVTPGSRSEPFTVVGSAIEMDHPVDSSSTLIRLTKEANRSKAVVGDIVTYTVTMQNTAAGSVTGITLDDIIPAGFKYINGRAILDDTSITDPTGTRPLSFNIGTIAAGATRTLKYQLVVGSGVGFGEYTNVAQAKNSGGLPISNTAREKVTIVPDSLFDLGTVIGKVFHDRNENGIQDKGEELIGGAKIVMEDGTVITTDKKGMYHLQGIMPGRHLFKIDMRTVPEGVTLTTEEAVVVDVTKGLMRKVNFGLKLPQGGQVKAKLFNVTTDTTMPKPRLNVAMLDNELVIKGDKLKEPAQFRIFTNYQMFIKKWKLEVLDKDTEKVVVAFKGSRKDIFVPIEWDGTTGKSKAVKLSEHRSYIYRLTTTGAGGKKDVTEDRSFTVKRQKAKISIFDDKDKKTDRQRQEEYRQWLDSEIKNNNLKTQTIEIKGQMVNITDIKTSGISITRDNLLATEVPVIGTEGYRASDLLAGRTQEQTKALSDIDLIMPNGEYQLKAVGSGGKSSGGTGTGDGASSTGEVAEYNQHIKIGDDYLFLVALGDAKIGYNTNTSNVETVNKDDRFDDGLWAEGRLAFHLKGKIKGKYLVTGSFDSDRDKKELFRNLDPDKYYPVYGDNSSASYASANTQGMLYLLVEWDKSSVLWGNYSTDFGDTEFAAFRRTLYGGKVHLESVSSTKYGEPTSKVIAFRAQAHQRASHNELLGTGGSLYYLKHKDIIEGSDKVQIETRDKVTGLVLSSKTMQEGIDYEIDYDNGRITFWQPVHHVTGSDSIISGNLLDGNPVYVVVDYEFETLDRFDEATVGARAQQAIGDRVVMGGTYVEEKQTTETYKLKGVDTTVHLGDNIKVTAEYAESESESMGSFISTDGGLNFTELPTAETSRGKAYGVKGEARLLDNKLGVDSYYKRIEKDFSSSATSSQQGKEMYGVSGTYDLSDNTRVKVTHDTQKLIDDGNAQTQLQVGATKTETTSAQIVHTSDRLKLTGEIRHQEITERKDQYESETNREEDVLAARADYKLTEKTTVSVEHQQSTADSSNNQTTFGVETRVGKSIALRAEETISPDGTATSVGITSNSKIGDKFDISADVGRATYSDGRTSNTASVSVNARVNEKTELRSTFAQTDSMDGSKTSSLALGAKRKINDEWEATSDRTFASSGDKNTIGTRLGFLRDRDGKILEGTFSREFSESSTETSNSNIFGLSGDISDKWAFSASFERGKVQNHDGTRATRNAGSFGLGFVDKDEETGDMKLKGSIKGELRLDDGNEDKRQYLIYMGLEGKVNDNTTLFTKVNLSQTKNTTTGRTDAMYKELVFGGAYRPVDHDWLNLIGKYTYLEDDAPVSQSSISGVDHEKAHVLAGEAVIDLNERWQLSEKFAYKTGKQKIDGFDFTESSTWLWANRISYKFDKGWMLSAEYRMLTQIEADDRRYGVLMELTKKINKNFEIGLGYNFTDFSDDLAHLDYTSQGPFIRITGKF